MRNIHMQEIEVNIGKRTSPDARKAEGSIKPMGQIIDARATCQRISILESSVDSDERLYIPTKGERKIKVPKLTAQSKQ